MNSATQRSATPPAAPAIRAGLRLSLSQSVTSALVGLALWFAGTQLVLWGGRLGWLAENTL